MNFIFSVISICIIVNCDLISFFSHENILDYNYQNNYLLTLQKDIAFHNLQFNIFKFDFSNHIDLSSIKTIENKNISKFVLTPNILENFKFVVTSNKINEELNQFIKNFTLGKWDLNDSSNKPIVERFQVLWNRCLWLIDQELKNLFLMTIQQSEFSENLIGPDPKLKELGEDILNIRKQMLYFCYKEKIKKFDFYNILWYHGVTPIPTISKELSNFNITHQNMLIKNIETFNATYAHLHNLHFVVRPLVSFDQISKRLFCDEVLKNNMYMELLTSKTQNCDFDHNGNICYCSSQELKELSFFKTRDILFKNNISCKPFPDFDMSVIKSDENHQIEGLKMALQEHILKSSYNVTIEQELEELHYYLERRQKYHLFPKFFYHYDYTHHNNSEKYDNTISLVNDNIIQQDAHSAEPIRDEIPFLEKEK